MKNAKIGNVLAGGGRTSDPMAKRIPPLDSAHRIGPITLWLGILILFGGCQKLGAKKRENRKHFGLWRQNQRSYGETGTTVGFSASNRSKYALGRDSNSSRGMSEIGV